MFRKVSAEYSRCTKICFVLQFSLESTRHPNAVTREVLLKGVLSLVQNGFGAK
jgi:hypothetical protein